MELTGSKIKKFRLDRRLSRKELADEIGVGFSTISGWELDKWGPNPRAKALLKKIPYCPVTTVTDDRLLEACHIKPRSKCSQIEQSDSNNGIMLTPTIHQLFDDGFITFEEKRIKVSPYISKINLQNSFLEIRISER